jgi:hypothetical protein
MRRGVLREYRLGSRTRNNGNPSESGENPAYERRYVSPHEARVGSSRSYVSDDDTAARAPEPPSPVSRSSPFRHAPSFHSLEDTGSFVPGDFVAQYERLFSEALIAGAIDAETRHHLNVAARALGIDGERLERLERALRAAYEARAPISAPALDGNDPHGGGRASLADGDVDGMGMAALVPESVRIYEPGLAQSPAIPSRPKDENDELRDRFLSAPHDERVRITAVLVQRGVASPEEHGFLEAQRTRTPPRPTQPLTAQAWERLIHPDEDRTIGNVFGVIASAVLVGRISAMRRDGRLPRLDPAKKQDPAVSTLSATRAIAWAAATLGLQIPPIYVAPEIDAGFQAIPGLPPAVRVGAKMLSGQSALGLAFHAGRHLSWFRSEHFVCTLVSQIADLQDIFVAALTIGAPRLELPDDIRTRASIIANAIMPVLEPAQLVALRDHVQTFLVTNGRAVAHSLVSLGERANLRRWARSAELTACRAGLLLSGDLTVASEAIAREPSGPERVRELERFWVSPEMTDLRRLLGVARLG